MRADDLINMTDEEWTARRKARINAILARLRRHPQSEKIHVVGSAAEGKPDPGDLDVVVDLREEPFDQKLLRGFDDLIALAGRRSGNYGLFDPFVMFKNILLVRNDEATGWIQSKNSRALRAKFIREMRPIGDLPE